MFGFAPFAKLPFSALGVGVAHNVELTEDTFFDDGLLASVSFYLSTIESITLDDSKIIQAQFSTIYTEDLNAADTINSNPFSLRVDYLASFTDNTTLAEDKTNVTQYFTSFSDNLNATDVITNLVQFSSSLTDNINSAGTQTSSAQFSSNITENTTSDDARTILANLKITIEENANIAETIVGGVFTLVNITESTTVADTPNFSAQFYLSIVEAWGLTPYTVSEEASFGAFTFGGAPIVGSLRTTAFNENPTYVVNASFLKAITENLTAQDSSVITAQFISNVIENLIARDSSTQTSAFLQTIVERLSTLDTYVAGSNFFQTRVENINVADPVFIFIMDLIELAMLQDNRQSYVDMYVYEALAGIDESSIINVTEYNDIQVYAELGEIDLT